MAEILINGKSFPAPDTGMKTVVTTNVSAGRNAFGEFIGDRVGRDLYKLDSLQWKFLSAETWSAILREFGSFVVLARIPDMVNNTWLTIRMYPGDRTATPCEWGADGLPTRYKDCKVNLIDCGVVT